MGQYIHHVRTHTHIRTILTATHQDGIEIIVKIFNSEHYLHSKRLAERKMEFLLQRAFCKELLGQ
jgi:hypothetical protein